MRQAITTRYIPATNTRGSRIKASADAGSIFIPWSHSLNSAGNHMYAAMSLAQKLKWNGEWQGGGVGSGYVFVMTDDDGNFRIEAMAA